MGSNPKRLPGVFRVLALVGLWATGAFGWCRAEPLPEGPPPGVVVVASPEPGHVRVASPCLIKTSDGSLLVSHDWGGLGRVLTSLHRSIDGGKTWHHLADVPDVMWATLFEDRERLYLLGTSRGFGDAVIRASSDGGKTWTRAQDESTGLLARGSYHCGPVPVLKAKGRIWRAFEHRGDDRKKREFTALVFSAPLDSDFLVASSWTRSNGIDWPEGWLPVRYREWIEGNLVLSPDGRVLNILRTNTHPASEGPLSLEARTPPLKRFEIVAAMTASDDGRRLSFDQTTDFKSMPGAQSKFTIRRDGQSGRYYSVVSKITAPELQNRGWEDSPHHQRNVLKLISSADLETWEEHATLLAYREGEALTKKNPIGFQYADWIPDGDDLIFVSRTAWTGASNYHDANYITFHRVKDFRNL